MLNGHPPEKPYFPTAVPEFATKTDVYVLENKVQGLVKEWGGMAESIKMMNEILTDVKTKIESLVTKKGINDGLKAYAYKCIIVFGSINSTLLVAHFVGLLKMIYRYLLS